MRRKKQADLLLLERSKRPGVVSTPGRSLSFIKRYGPDVVVVVGSYAAFVWALGWIVPTLIGVFIGVLAWAVVNGGDES